VIFAIIFAGDKFIYEETVKHSLYGWQPEMWEAKVIAESCKDFSA
jgi:hypothetical protein